jgi:hypothetical protein
MRDLVVREALVTMAGDAAKRFRDLVAEGEEIPYDVREPGQGSAIAEYAPLTERFVREHALVLREVDSFGSACAAVESADLAAPYLEQFDIAIPGDARGRAELACTVFLCRLWLGSTDFSLEHDRLAVAIDELQRTADADQGEIEVIVPLRGLQMPLTRVDLATASIVRADSVEVPAEARSPEGTGLAGWEPTYLAVTSVSVNEDDEDAPDPGMAAVAKLRALITTLRLFKPGGVALGPHAWTRIAGDRWRRIATGAGRPRPGGYRLMDSEVGSLTAFSRSLLAGGSPFRRIGETEGGFPAVLSRALSRFEAGLERNAVLEALNDYLLALRFMLEGGGPADMGLPMRVAALCAEPDQRSETKSVLDRAIALERELWSGEPAGRSAAPTPAQTAGDVEDLLRAILKDAACGHLGSDLRATADEILLADGLAVGEAADTDRGATAEWSLGSVDELPEGFEAEDDEGDGDEGEYDGSEDVEEVPVEEDFDDLDDDDGYADDEDGENAYAPETMTLKVPEPLGRINVEYLPQREEFQEQMAFAHAHPEPEAHERPHRDAPSPVARLLEEHSAQREATRSRVANLFPRPETTEWNVREIGYDRTRRADVQEAS